MSETLSKTTFDLHFASKSAGDLAGLIEMIVDTIAAALVAGTNVTISYDDPGGLITINSSGGGGVSDGDKGDITVLGGVWTIDSDVVSYAKIQNVSATDKLLGRSTAGAGDIEEIPCTAAGRALLDDADAAAQRTTLSAAKSGANTDITSVALENNGLMVKDTAGDHKLTIRPIEDLTADRVLSFAVNDVNRSVTFAGNTTLSGTNTGDQDLSPYAPLASPALTGNPTAPTQASGNNSTRIATTAFVMSELALAVAGLLEFKADQNCSANPNYPAASKGDTYYVTAAGKIGGAAGKSVDIGDAFIAKADNAGGTEAAVGSSWFVLEHNLAGALLSANNLSDLADAAAARLNLGVAIGTHVQAFSAMLDYISVLADPGADRILYWDTGNSRFAWLEIGTNLSITGGVLNAAGGSGLSAAQVGARVALGI